MARTNQVQTSFRQGEWSPFSQGRSDTEEYYAALSVCMDFHPVDAGALVRRSGTQFAAVLDVLQGGTTPYVQLMPFDTDDGNHYACVLLPGTMQFFSAGAPVTLAATEILSVSQTAPALFTTSQAHGLSVGELITFVPGDNPGETIAKGFLNVQMLVDTVPSSTTFTATYAGARLGEGDVDASDFCFTTGSIAEIRSTTVPYTVSSLVTQGVKYNQDSDFLYLFHPDFATQMISETLALSEATFQDGPYYDTNETTTTLALSGTTGSVTVTASAIVGINGGTGFQATDVGRLIRWQDPAGNWTWLKITARASTTSITATIMGDDASAGTATVTWRLGLFSDTTGWPTHGVFHELRMWLVSDAQTKRIDGSRIIKSKETPDGVFSFAPTDPDGTVADNHAVSAEFNATGRNRATWISVDDTGLLVGTSDGVWVIQASQLDDPITPTSIQARRKSLFKSSDARPALVNRSTVFVGDLEKEVIEIRRYEGGYDAKNVSRNGEHLTSAGIDEIYYANSPLPTLWARTSNKQLIGASFRRDVDGEQTGWHQHNLNYTLDPDKTATTGKLEAITVVKKSDKDSSKIDTLWAVVERDGNYVLEFMTPLFDQSRIELEGFFVDSGLTYDTSNYSTSWGLTNPDTNEYTFYGLWHLEGQVVDLTWRTIDMGQLTVANGRVSKDIPDAALALPESYSSFKDTAETSFIREHTRSFVPGFVSELSTALRMPTNGGMFVEGTDGETYVLLGDSAGSQSLFDVNTGVGNVVMSVQQNYNDLQAAGQDPLGKIGGNGIGADGTDIGAYFAIRGTPYIVLFGAWTYTGGSPGARFGIHYYRVDGPTDLVYVGGYMDSMASIGSSDAPSGADKSVATHLVETGSGPLEAEILYMWGQGNDENFIMKFPSVNEAIAQGFSFNYDSPDDRIVKTPADWMNLSPNMSAALPQGNPIGNRACFAPVTSTLGAAYLISHQNRGLAIADSDSTGHPNETVYSLARSLEFPNGWVTGVLYTGDDDVSGTLGSPEIMNCRIRDKNALPVVPFEDAGKNHLGDFTDDADDYMNPYFFPSDPDDPSKPWMVFWPKIYFSSETIDDTGTYITMRVFQWDPLGRVMTQMENLEGSLFDVFDETSEVNAGNEVTDIGVHWTNAEGKIYIYLRYAHGASPLAGSSIVSHFGTFTVDFSEGSTDIVTREITTRGFDAVVGLNYASQAQLLRPENGTKAGPDLAKTRRIDQVGMIMHRTGPFRLGTDFVTMDSHTPSEELLETGQRPLFTGIFHDSVADDYGYDGQIAWKMDRPGPGSFLAVGGFRNTQDR